MASWDQVNERAAVLQALLEAADARPDGIVPWEAHPRARRAFPDEAELRGALQARWATRLLAELDAVVDLPPGRRHDAVGATVERLAQELPGLSALLTAPGPQPYADRAELTELVDLTCGCGGVHAAWPLAPAPEPAALKVLVREPRSSGLPPLAQLPARVMMHLRAHCPLMRDSAGAAR